MNYHMVAEISEAGTSSFLVEKIVLDGSRGMRHALKCKISSSPNKYGGVYHPLFVEEQWGSSLTWKEETKGQLW